MSLMFSIFLVAAPALALDLDEILSDPEQFDGQTVQLTGEFVGDYSERTDGYWVQLNVDGYVDAPLLETGELQGRNSGIGAFFPKELFSPTWGDPGGFRQRGPIVVVTAVFRYHDPRFQGETYLDVTDITLVEASKELAEGDGSTTIIVGLIAIGLAAIIHFGTGGFKRLARRFG